MGEELGSLPSGRDVELVGEQVPRPGRWGDQGAGRGAGGPGVRGESPAGLPPAPPAGPPALGPRPSFRVFPELWF